MFVCFETDEMEQSPYSEEGGVHKHIIFSTVYLILPISSSPAPILQTQLIFLDVHVSVLTQIQFVYEIFSTHKYTTVGECSPLGEF